MGCKRRGDLEAGTTRYIQTAMASVCACGDRSPVAGPSLSLNGAERPCDRKKTANDKNGGRHERRQLRTGTQIMPRNVVNLPGSA